MPADPRQYYQGLVSKYADRFKVPTDLALAVLETESSFRPDAVSPKGAKGLFQLMPLLIREYEVTDPFDPEENIRAGVQHLGVLLRKYDEDDRLAVAAYNAGESAVAQAQGVPPFKETQTYLAKVQNARAQFQRGPSQEPVMAQQSTQPREFEQWIYPSIQLGSDEMRNEDGEVLSPEHADRQGILISWAGLPGDAPRDEQIAEIFRQVDPEGIVTREDAAALGALSTTAGVGAGRMAVKGGQSLLRRIGMPIARTAVAGGRFAPGVGWALPALAAVGAAGGEYWRQQQVPKEVAGFGIESWPRIRFGMPYEGAPDTPYEAAASMAAMALQEALGETAGGFMANLWRRAGKAWKTGGFKRDVVQRFNKGRPGFEDVRPITGQQGVGKILAETGTAPTIASAKTAEAAIDATETAAGKIIGEADEAVGGGLSILTEDVITETQKVLNRGVVEGVGRPARQSIGGAPGLQDAMNRAFEQMRNMGPERSIAVWNGVRKEANVLGAPAWRAMSEIATTPEANNSLVQAGLGQALKTQIARVLRASEEGFRRRVPLGQTSPPRMGRYADRWTAQVDNVGQYLIASQVARESAQTGISGLLAGGLAYGAPAAALGLTAGAGMGVPAALGVAAMSQLAGRGRSALGGGIYRSGGTLGRLPINLLRSGAIPTPEPPVQFGMTPSLFPEGMAGHLQSGQHLPYEPTVGRMRSPTATGPFGGSSPYGTTGPTPWRSNPSVNWDSFRGQPLDANRPLTLPTLQTIFGSPNRGTRPR